MNSIVPVDINTYSGSGWENHIYRVAIVNNSIFVRTLEKNMASIRTGSPHTALGLLVKLLCR
jgi:hypothetical protein